MGKLPDHELDWRGRLRRGLLRRAKREQAQGTLREIRDKKDIEIKDPG